MIADLIRHHESVLRLMRPVVGAAGIADDFVTADLLTGMMAQHEKDVWMLRAMLKR
jgi:starvation-inducible DNA-binding protein